MSDEKTLNPVALVETSPDTYEGLHYMHELSPGDVLHINGIPVRYLGNGFVGSTTKFGQPMKESA